MKFEQYLNWREVIDWLFRKLGKNNVVKIALALFFVILLQIVNISFGLIFDNVKVRHRIDDLIDKSNLAISYQGIEFSIFNGLRIIGAKVSFDSDFSRGRYFLDAEEVYLRGSVLALYNFNIENPEQLRVVFNRTKFSVWMQDASDGEFIKEKIKAIFYQNFKVHSECHDCEFEFNYKGNQYKKETTLITNLNFSFIKNIEALDMYLTYRDSSMGNANVTLHSPLQGDGECIRGASALIELNSFPVAAMNYFQSNYQFISGKFSGGFFVNQKTCKASDLTKKSESVKTELKAQSNFKFENIQIANEKQAWYDAKLIAGKFTYGKIDDTATANISATIDNYQVNLAFDNLTEKKIPTHALLTVTPLGDAKNYLTLPGGVKINGVKELKFELGEPSYNTYKKSELKFEILDGEIYEIAAGYRYSIKLSKLVAQLKDSQFNLETNGSIEGESFSATMQGALGIIPISYTPIPDIVSRRTFGEEIKIIALKSKLMGGIKIPRLKWQNFIPWIRWYQNEYWVRVRKWMQYSWLPSKVREREYFVRFIENMDVILNIEIENLIFEQTMPLKGYFFMSPGYANAGLTLESPDKAISNKFVVSYFMNEPYFQHEIRLDLKQGYSILSPFLNTEQIEYFSSVQLAMIDNYSGERVADHYLKSATGGQLRLTKVRLGKYAEENFLPRQWNILEIHYNNMNSRGQITQFKAENDNQIMVGYGDYKLFDKNLFLNLKHNVYMK